MDNFEKAGINKIDYKIKPRAKRPNKIEQFKIIQIDHCPQNKSNPALRYHNTDIMFLNYELEKVLHFDILIED